MLRSPKYGDSIFGYKHEVAIGNLGSVNSNISNVEICWR